MSAQPVKMLTTRNYRLIEDDVKAALWYETDATIEIVQYKNPTNEVVVVVDRNRQSPISGVWKVMKHRGPLHLGHNGYTFERVNSTGDTLQLWDIAARSFDAAPSAGGIIIDGGEDVYALAAEIAESDAALIAALDAETPAAPAVDPDRERVIDRALETGRKYTDDQVAQYPLLRRVALEFVQSYRGHNDFVQSLAVKLVDYGSLSNAQLRGALNVMVAEARIERAELARERALENVAVDISDYTARGDEPKPFMDLRRQSDRQIADAGDAIPPEAERNNEVEPAIPNGVYTVLLDDAGKTYRTLRVKTPPDHFTVKPGTQLIEFLNGPDNSSDYTGFAFLAGRRVSIWSRFKTADALRQAADRLVADPMTAAREYVMRSNRCFVCNRPLSTPESIARGIGPICAEQIGAMGFVLALRGDRDSAVEENDARDRLTRLAGPSPAEQALARARARQAAAGPISAAQAQADIDELFPE